MTAGARGFWILGNQDPSFLAQPPLARARRTWPSPDSSASRSAASPATMAARHIPGAGELFLAFAKMALCCFGGVLAWSRRIIVQERGWLTPEEFNEQLALCQVLPGGNIL